MIVPKFLTHNNYRSLLAVLGANEQPLSAYQTAKALRLRRGRRSATSLKSGRYAYEMLKLLSGEPQERWPLEDWPIDNKLQVRTLHPKYSEEKLASDPKLLREFERKLKRATPGPVFLQVVADEEKQERKYWLNFRGFLLYLYLEAKADRADRERINKVLANPAISKLAPFLQFWQDFEAAGFHVVDFLKAIGNEYQTQLDHDLDYLLHKVGHEYFVTVSRYFDDFDRDMLRIYKGEYIGPQLRATLKEYRQMMLDFLENSAKKQLEDIKAGRQFFARKDLDMEMAISHLGAQEN